MTECGEKGVAAGGGKNFFKEEKLYLILLNSFSTLEL